MAHCKNRRDDIDITTDELNQIKEALKKEEFRKLFIDYVQEINDPENRALFEKEIKQYEKERGINVTFVHPVPGYVIKTSADGAKKAFINICENENVDKPSSTEEVQKGSSGTQWSLPYIQAPPRDDLDKTRKLCVVYDVIFHPFTLELARKDQRIKKFVDDTALDAVEKTYGVTLDRTNLKFPKMGFKGYKHPCIIRKKDTDQPGPSDDIIPNPYYPYSEPCSEPAVVTPRHDTPVEKYTTPIYQIKHRKNLDLQEFRYAPDAKMNSCIANELLIEISLPLICSTSDVELLLSDKSLSLKSEKPAKYKLDISLPYSIIDSESSAKFDSSSRTLFVNAVVDRKKHCLTRDDSGLESDPSRGMSSSSEEDITKMTDKSSFTESNIISDDNNEEKLSDDKEDYFSIDSHEDMEMEIAEPFLNPERYYLLPSYSLFLNSDTFSIDLTVKNVEPSSLDHMFSENNAQFQIKFYSMGAGFVPVYFSVVLKLGTLIFEPDSLIVETHDDSVKIGITLKDVDASCLGSVFIGRDEMSFQEVLLADLGPAPYIPRKILTDNQGSSKVNTGGVIRKLSKLRLYTTAEDDSDDCEEEEMANVPESSDNMIIPDVSTSLESNMRVLSSVKAENKIRRTHSESGCALPIPIVRRRSILKDTRSLSESSANDYAGFSLSMESEDGCGSPCENGHMKKHVRFSDTISKKVFRVNSSILGQRKKNQRKAKNKKKAHERRNSESSGVSESEVSELEVSEVSDLSEVSDVSETSESDDGSNQPTVSSTPCSKSHRRKGKKNHRKSANTAKINCYFDNDA